VMRMMVKSASGPAWSSLATAHPLTAILDCVSSL
jgi:hypothetical protein